MCRLLGQTHPYAVLLGLLETQQREYGNQNKEHHHAQLYIRIYGQTVQQQGFIKTYLIEMFGIRLVIVYLDGVAQAAHTLHVTVQVLKGIGLTDLYVQETLDLVFLINDNDRNGLVAR